MKKRPLCIMFNLDKKLGDFAARCIKLLWQERLGPWYNNRRNIVCRFYPTCSEYAIVALREHGLVRGVILAWGRVRRCTPDNCDSCFDPP